MSIPPSILEGSKEKGAKTTIDTSVSPLSEHLQVDVPDGGIQAWMSVFGGWLVLFATLGYAQSFGVYQDLYTRKGTSTSSNISWIGSFQFFMMFAMSLPVGKLYDSGYFHHLQFVGGLLMIFSLFMLSLADPSKFYQVFLSQGVGVGLGMGCLFLPAISVQAQHWQKYRALAMGIVITGSSFGGIALPIMHNQLFNGKAGFAWGVRASAFLLLGMLIIAKAVMTTRYPANHHSPKANIKEVFKHIPFIIAVIGNLLGLLGLFFPYFYLQLYMNVQGLDGNLAFYTLAILNASSVFGRTVPNYLADSWGRFNALTPVTFLCGALVFAMLGLKNTAGVLVFSILYGFFSGAFVSLGAPLIATLVPNIRQLGVYLGVGYFITSFGLLAGNPICGALLGSHFLWWRPVTFSGIVILLGATFILWARFLHAHQVQSQCI